MREASPVARRKRERAPAQPAPENLEHVVAQEEGEGGAHGETGSVE